VGAGLGTASISDGAEREEYISYLYQTVSADFSKFRVLIDCANGSASSTAQQLFARLPGLRFDIISAQPDGININASCGSTHLDNLSKLVVDGGYDLGIAFDGDADRCLCVDEKGGEIDGDKMMAVCARMMRTEGQLPDCAIVATVMSNIGLHRYCQEEGFKLTCTAVGDRNVLECMLEHGYAIGGEQSGHMIFLALATTGDGQLTALQFLQVLAKADLSASELVSCCPKYPQVLKNMKISSVDDKNRIMSSESLNAEIAAVEALLGDSGRVLIRPSGTEALIRVMVEAKSAEDAVFYTERLVKFIENL
jgi:Phosphomannomutase